jgi:Tfp pilus assembly protein FimT
LVICLLGLFVALAVVNMENLLGSNSSRAHAYELVESIQMAAMKASQNGKRYEIIIDMSNQGYILREISSGNLADVLQEEVIKQKLLGPDLKFKYVKFDDVQNETATSGEAKFRVGRTGFQFGGKIVLVDRDLREYSIVINRLSRQVTLANGDVDFLQPQDDVPF